MSHKLSTKVLRAMSVFSGLQVFTVICSVIRTKLIALWIGPEGVGLFGLYNNAIEMLGQVSNLGVRQSSVRDVVGTIGQRLAVIAAVIRRWGYWLGAMGALLTLSLARPLSELTFGDDAHAWQFVALSVVVVFTSIINSEQAIMQGLHRLRSLAMSSLWGAVGGLMVSIPMFYFWRVDSIVPSIIAYAVIVCVSTLIYRARVPRLECRVGVAETFSIGKRFITLGFFMTLASFFDMLANYVFMAYLNVEATTEVVGYYQAGSTLFNRYIWIVINGIAMEFYPRITGVVGSRLRTSAYVDHEIRLLLWVFIPLVCVFITCAEPLVLLLYADDFLSIIPFITWGILGSIPRLFSWCLGITILARGDSRAFIFTETFSALSGLGLNLLFYHLFGLTGLGIAYLLWYMLYCGVVSVIYFGAYRMKISSRAWLFMGVAMTVTVATAALSLAPFKHAWILPTVISVVAVTVSLIRLAPILLRRH